MGDVIHLSVLEMLGLLLETDGVGQLEVLAKLTLLQVRLHKQMNYKNIYLFCLVLVVS